MISEEPVDRRHSICLRHRPLNRRPTSRSNLPLRLGRERIRALEPRLELAVSNKRRIARPFGIQQHAVSKPSNFTPARQLLAQIDWNRKERPKGALPIDLKNPSAYLKHCGSNKTLLAEGTRLEPMGWCCAAYDTG